jgi:hypothetical protein
MLTLLLSQVQEPAFQQDIANILRRLPGQPQVR